MKFTQKLLGAVALCAASWGANATPVVGPTFVAGTAYNTGAIAGFAVTGMQTQGISVTATFGSGNDAFSETVFWKLDSITGEYGAFGEGWGLTLTGDSISNPWELFHNLEARMSRLVINGQPGGVVFDVQSEPDNPNDPPASQTFGSPGSAIGKAISEFLQAGPVAATYSNRVLVNEVDYGDLYTTLVLDFSGIRGGGIDAAEYSFIADTDHIADGSRLEPFDPQNPVPEPAGLALVGAALLGLGLTRRRRA